MAEESDIHCDYLELGDIDTTNEQHSKSHLYNVHRNQFERGITNENNVVEVINILGGIEQIEKTCNVNHRFLKFKSLKDQRLEYNIDDENTFWHNFCNRNTANKLISILHNKWMKVFIIIVHGTWSLWWIFLTPDWGSSEINYKLYFIYKDINLCIVSIWQIMIILGANKRIFWMVTSSFWFWFKMWLIIRYVIYFLIILYYYDVYEYQGHIFGNIVLCIHLVLLILMTCIPDAFHIDKRLKLFWSFVALFVVGSWAISDMYYSSLGTNISVGITVKGVKISGYTEMIDSEATLLLVFCKQIFTLIKNWNHGSKATILRLSPRFQLIDYNIEQMDVDEILKYYLSPQNSVNLSPSQLRKISAVLSSNEKIMATVTFHRDDTIITPILGSKTAKWIRALIFARRTVTTTLVIMSVDWMITYLFGSAYGDLFHCYYFLLLFGTFMTSNTYAIKLSISTFTFWYKIYLALRDIICWAILIYYLGIESQWSTQFGLINLMLLVIIFSSIDGVIESWKVKICSMILITAYNIIRTFWHISEKPEMDATIINVFGIYSTSIYDQMINAQFTLCVFMCKHTLALFLTKNKCVNIVQSPYIIWNDSY